MEEGEKKKLSALHKEMAMLPHQCSTVCEAKQGFARLINYCCARTIKGPGFQIRNSVPSSLPVKLFWHFMPSLQLQQCEIWVCFNESQPHYKFSGM